MNKQVEVVLGAISRRKALSLVSSLTGDMHVMLEPEKIYPYYYFDAHCSVPTLAGRKDISLQCLVDAVNGLGATADSFEAKTDRVRQEDVVSTAVQTDAAAAIAQRTVTHRMGRKLRMIASFDVAIVPRGIVHKRFWIVQTSAARIMIDSTTGKLHPLTLKVA